MPAGMAYGALVDALGDDSEAIFKDLEVYARPDPPPDYALELEIEGVLRTARDAGFERFHMVGYSAGGASSLAFAAQHPERLFSLALIEPAWMGNEGLSPEEQRVRHEIEGVMTLPPEEILPAFVSTQLASGVAPPPTPPGPPPPWMASRPAGLRALMRAFNASTLDLGRLSGVELPVYFAVGGRSNPDYYARMAERAREIFSDLTVDVFAERHHFDPPHRIEPERTAQALRAHWARAQG